MNKFKVGDSVKCTSGSHVYITVGGIYKVDEISSTGKSILITTLNSGQYWYNIGYFELVSPDFDMINEPWLIRVSNEVEFELAKEFVKSKGFKFAYDDHYDHTCPNITNRSRKGLVLHKGLMYVLRSSGKDNKRKEIKLNFKTVIDNVEYPEVKSKEQLEIEEIESEMQRLQDDMRKLADRLNKLKGN